MSKINAKVEYEALSTDMQGTDCMLILYVYKVATFI